VRAAWVYIGAPDGLEPGGPANQNSPSIWFLIIMPMVRTNKPDDDTTDTFARDSDFHGLAGSLYATFFDGIPNHYVVHFSPQRDTSLAEIVGVCDEPKLCHQY